MLVLGLHGSPRRKGNTHFLLRTFLEEAAQLGARTHMVEVARRNILPCKELVVCEKKGFCPIDDDMNAVFALLREAEVIVAASPVFFYNVTAQLKALIDRCQTLWARKYRLKLADPARRQRRGVLLAAGATRGQNLFEGLRLTAQYFFDAVDAKFDASLTYRGIEGPKDMAAHPGVREEVRETAMQVLRPLIARKKILFLGRGNACRSQMAAAFAQIHAGERVDATCAGRQPADAVNPMMVAAMQENGIDMAYRHPQSAEAAIDGGFPEMVVGMDSNGADAPVAGAERIDWGLPEPEENSMEAVRRVRDELETRVKEFIDKIV
jgi:multimeric flavodoxin WrbA/protein-tyrosine-phosphatase